MVEKYKFVGSGVTNSQGVAQLTHDANGNPLATPGYVGSGKGLTQMCASLDSPTAMSSGSDQSETYSLEDCLKYDLEVLASKSYNIALSDIDFYLEFIVHPTASSNSTGYINITDGNNNYLQIGDLYGSTNVNCGVNWTGGTFYGKQITVDTDTKITLRRTGTSMVLTVGESTYNISNMNITCNTLLNAVISNNQIKQFKIYPI